MYQSERVGDKAKKRKSPAKSERVGIFELYRTVLSICIDVTWRAKNTECQLSETESLL